MPESHLKILKNDIWLKQSRELKCGKYLYSLVYIQKIHVYDQMWTVHIKSLLASNQDFVCVKEMQMSDSLVTGSLQRIHKASCVPSKVRNPLQSLQFIQSLYGSFLFSFLPLPWRSRGSLLRRRRGDVARGKIEANSKSFHSAASKPPSPLRRGEKSQL